MILRPGNAAANLIAQGMVSTPGATAPQSQGDAHAFTPSAVVRLRRTYPYPTFPLLPYFFPTPLIIFLPLVGIAGCYQSEHRHPYLARPHGEELDGAFPARLYGLPKPFRKKPSTDAVRHVPDWFAFTPLDTLQDAAAARLQALTYSSR
jgi:hypothetical protein